MSFDFIKHIETDNLAPLSIENKENYYFDLRHIEDNMTGRVDAFIANAFIQEAVQLIINAIALFEQGYFDASFYSLRQSLELSTVMVYLIDNNEDVRKEELKKWKSQSKFPMYQQMLKLLEQNATVFFDIKLKLGSYFDELDKIKQKLNKYVHKQGFSTFYVSRNRWGNQNKDMKLFVAEFEVYLERCIGAIAIFRLAIDPLPILLNDENIYSRTGDFITDGYSDKFIEKYIGTKYMDLYKKTEVYQDSYNSIISEESKNKFVLNVVKNQFIDKENIKEILKQKHLLSRNDLIAVLLCKFSKEIAKVYCISGLHWYFSTTKTKKKRSSYHSRDFENFEKSEQNYNLKYDEVFISTLKLNDECYFIEHNEKFTENEIKELKEQKHLLH